jgi:hypothetical protein
MNSRNLSNLHVTLMPQFLSKEFDVAEVESILRVMP